MKFKRIVSIFLVAITLFMCTGCSLNLFSTETLLKPPALSGKSGEVQDAFNKLMSGKTFQLKTPTKGEYKSSFVLYDIDADSEEEALVFYTESSTDTTVRIAVLDCVKETWVLACDIKGSGSGVYDVSFPDLDGDSKSEIIVAWSLFDNKITKMLTVYKTNNVKNSLQLETLANEYFNEKTYLDLNSDGTDDLILVYLDDAGEVQNSYFRAFSLEKNSEIVKFSELLLDSSITSVSAINSDSITRGDKSYSRIFIDCLKSDTSIFTEVISWDLSLSRASRVISDPIKNTLRNAKILSRDIDNDGNLEIPVTTKFFTAEKESVVVLSGVTYSFTMIEWMNVAGDKSDEVIKTVYNPIHSFLYVFPWGNNMTVNFDKIENQTNFCIWNSKTKEIEDTLFSIKFVENKNLEDNTRETDDSLILKETETGVFFFEITSFGEEFGITEEKVKSSFIII